MHVAIVTAGGAGMFCGSCMHDNLWARALQEAGWQVTLIPLYTPIRVDDADQTSTRIFFGGINVYLDAHLPGWRWLPRGLTRWLDAPWLLRAVSQRGVSNNAAELGALTESTIAGKDGAQAKEGAALIRFLTTDLKPDVIIFSNLMLCGIVPELRERFAGPVWCLLQGDDIFLNRLVEPYRSRTLQRLRFIGQQLTGCVVHSQFYAEVIRALVGWETMRTVMLPLGIDCRGHLGRPRAVSSPATIGYFARIAEEKGLRQLVEAALVLQHRGIDFRLLAGGYLSAANEPYLEEVRRLAAPLGDRFRYAGSPDTLAEKVALYKQFDILSVPAPYHDPKGLYVLEAWANGVPVVQPAHGHFPELIEATGGGLCVDPNNPQALADGLERLLKNEEERRSMAEQGWQGVRHRHDLPALVQATENWLRSPTV
jgi:glycosyltransferase involved in cell wall biosynthesis